MFHILIADGKHDLDEIFVRENGVEKYYYYYFGGSTIKWRNKVSNICWNHSIINFIHTFCWCLLTDRLVQTYSLYNWTNDTDLVTILAASFCMFCKVLASCCG